MPDLIRLTLFLIIIAGWGVAPASEAGERLQSVRRIVVFGDSITQAGDYVTDIECWLLTEGLAVEVINLGLGSETAADLTPGENAAHLKAYGFGRPFISERLARSLTATKPDLVIACYGMNDSSSLPATPAGDLRYQHAITDLRQAVLSAGAKRVVICSPPIRSSPADASIGRYATWLLGQRAAGWDTVDLHGPMQQALLEHRQHDPAFAFSKDGVHPGREGHWLMAREILTQSFGAKLAGVTSAEGLFATHGAEIRDMVAQRMKLRFAAWMSLIGHQRPGVPGAPGSKPTLTLAQAETRATDLTAQIVAELPAR